MLIGTVTGRASDICYREPDADDAPARLSLTISSRRFIGRSYVTTQIAATIWGNKAARLVNVARNGRHVVAMGELFVHPNRLELSVHDIDFSPEARPNPYVHDDPRHLD